MTPNANCPLCNGKSRTAFKKDPVDYYICGSCASMYIYPMPSVETMRKYAEAQYKEGSYTAYVASKSLKVHTFEDRMTKIKPLFASVKQNGKIKHLDVGCSAGFMIEVGIENGFDSYGVEFSSEAIALADERIRPRITNADINKMNLNPADRFDLITCYDIIEHLQDPTAFFKALKNVLKPGGVVVLTTPDSEHWLAKVMGRSWPMLQPFQHTILFSKRALRQTLKNAGFEELASGSAYKVLTLDYLIGQIKELNPILSRVMSFIGIFIPKAIMKKPLRLNISELMSVARAV